MVDPLVADSWAILLLEPKADLFRAPILTQQLLDKIPHLRGNAGTIFGLSTMTGELMGLLGPISGQPNETVFQLPLTYFVAGT